MNNSIQEEHLPLDTNENMQMAGNPWFGMCGFGGTIAMASHGHQDGVSPELTASDLISAVPQLESIGAIRCHTVTNVGSPSVTFDSLRAGFQWASDAVKQGARGVVMSHGTDTIEESAYFMDLLWDHEEPLVFTGAMRAPDDPGADGPANLLDAFIVANSLQARGLGVLLTINNEVHMASRVTKTHSFATNAFASPWLGPIGRVTEGALELVNYPSLKRSQPLAIPADIVNVPVFTPGVGCDGGPLGALLQMPGCRGIVIAGMGAGHVPASYLDLIDEAVRRGIAVVMTTRTLGGRTGVSTYGYPGAEVDLRQRGVIFARSLQPLKARMLLGILLGNGVPMKQVQDIFQQRE